MHADIIEAIMKTYITSDPKINRGAPSIKGTRVLLSRIIFLLKEGYPLEVIHDMFPHVSVKTLEAAINEHIEVLDKNHASKTSSPTV